MLTLAHTELLTRMKLYITAAYIRKYSVFPDIRSPTNVRPSLPIDHPINVNDVFLSAPDNGLYILWAMRKAHPRPAKWIHVHDLHVPCGTVLALVRPFSLSRLSLKCWLGRARSHLPVKSLLFQCAVCSHGGHQACYRRFYTEMPLVPLPGPQSPLPGSPLRLPPRPRRSSSRSKDRESDDQTDIVVLDYSFDTSTVAPTPRQLMGHPCAAGCGHFCWVANFREDDEKP